MRKLVEYKLIKKNCVALFNFIESDVGGWGPWSNWTPCSTTCSGGTRNRYRVCDSPPPRYGAMFCEVRLILFFFIIKIVYALNMIHEYME